MLTRKLLPPETTPLLLGVSAPMWHLYEDLRQAGRSDAKVLITGESGVGKEVAARLVHAYSARRSQPFSPVNCGGVADALLESELFGHERGSYTDAHRDTSGLIERANGGTLFLDEVGEMSPRMQSVLLRFLESGEIQRIGAHYQPRQINVRVIAATNRVLLDCVAAHNFREDLYYRLNVIHLVVPPLRARRDDIVPLLRYFLNQAARRHHTPPPDIPAAVLDALVEYDWPGNVRELRNVAERLIARGGSQLTADDVPHALVAAAAPSLPLPIVAAPVDPRQAHPESTTRELFDRMVTGGESFWAIVHKPFMTRDMTRAQVRTIVSAGLAEAHGNYRLLVKLFNMPASDYHRFLNFLHAHDCTGAAPDGAKGNGLRRPGPPKEQGSTRVNTRNRTPSAGHPLPTRS